MANNALTILKSARESAVKNRNEAIQKASKSFDEEIAGLDLAIRQLSGVPAKKAAPKKAAPKKASPKKVVPAKKAAPKKIAPKKAPKKATPKKVVKKAAPKKSATIKKLVVSHASGNYPKGGSIADKLVFVLASAKKFLDIHDIAVLVNKHEPSLKPEQIKPQFGKHMPEYRKQGKIVSYQDKESNKVYYGIPAYMKDGKILQEHEPVPAP